MTIHRVFNIHILGRLIFLNISIENILRKTPVAPCQESISHGIHYCNVQLAEILMILMSQNEFDRQQVRKEKEQEISDMT